jgi:hypothetical protein
MKISVITLHTVKNYGSVLQTYATQSKLEQMGAEVEFVDYWRENNLGKNSINWVLSLSERWNRNPLTRLIYKAVKYPSLWKGTITFGRFVKRHIILTPRRYLTLSELAKDPPVADLYCTGSDQVWNSTWNGGVEKPYFLDYVPENKKRIAFAASFGKTELDSKERKTAIPLLQKYSKISVRESSGVRILEKMGISHAVQIMDPTLLLCEKDWKKLTAKRKTRQEYVLIYQLNPNKDFDNYAKRVAKKKKMRLIRVSTEYCHAFRPGHLVWCPSVENWLSLFYYADFVLTDSFHGTAFSIIFKKQFAVIYPPKYFDRLKNILDLTGLENRVVGDYENFSPIREKIDYRPVNEILARERAKADAFLKEALYP